MPHCPTQKTLQACIIIQMQFVHCANLTRFFSYIAVIISFLVSVYSHLFNHKICKHRNGKKRLKNKAYTPGIIKFEIVQCVVAKGPELSSWPLPQCSYCYHVHLDRKSNNIQMDWWDRYFLYVTIIFNGNFNFPKIPNTPRFPK